MKAFGSDDELDDELDEEDISDEDRPADQASYVQQYSMMNSWECWGKDIDGKPKQNPSRKERFCLQVHSIAQALFSDDDRTFSTREWLEPLSRGQVPDYGGKNAAAYAIAGQASNFGRDPRPDLKQILDILSDERSQQKYIITQNLKQVVAISVCDLVRYVRLWQEIRVAIDSNPPEF